MRALLLGKQNQVIHQVQISEPPLDPGFLTKTEGHHVNKAHFLVSLKSAPDFFTKLSGEGLLFITGVYNHQRVGEALTSKHLPHHKMSSGTQVEYMLQRLSLLAHLNIVYWLKVVISHSMYIQVYLIKEIPPYRKRCLFLFLLRLVTVLDMPRSIYF